MKSRFDALHNNTGANTHTCVMHCFVFPWIIYEWIPLNWFTLEWHFTLLELYWRHVALPTKPKVAAMTPAQYTPRTHCSNSSKQKMMCSTFILATDKLSISEKQLENKYSQVLGTYAAVLKKHLNECQCSLIWWLSVKLYRLLTVFNGLCSLPGNITV